MALTKEQFEAKYNFPKPVDLQERDLIVASNLSDLVYCLEREELREKTNKLKEFLWDTDDLSPRERV